MLPGELGAKGKTMSWKFDTVKGKLPGVLKAAGLTLDDAQAGACVSAVAALIPEGELLTSEESHAALHSVREEAKAAREAATALLEKVTGMRRDQFADQDRVKLMTATAEERLQKLATENETYQKQFEPMKQKLTAYETREAETVKTQYAEVSKKLAAILAVPEHKATFASKFVAPEADKELTVAQMQKNVETFNDLCTIGVPAFQARQQQNERTQNPLSGGSVPGPNRSMTAKELAARRAAMGVH